MTAKPFRVGGEPNFSWPLISVESTGSDYSSSETKGSAELSCNFSVVFRTKKRSEKVQMYL